MTLGEHENKEKKNEKETFYTNTGGFIPTFYIGGFIPTVSATDVVLLSQWC